MSMFGAKANQPSQKPSQPSGEPQDFVPVSSILHSANAASEYDNLFLMAAAINIYNQSMLRVRGTPLYGPTDVKDLLTMLEILLEGAKPNQPSFAPTPKAKLSPDQEVELLTVRDKAEAVKKILAETETKAEPQP